MNNAPSATLGHWANGCKRTVEKNEAMETIAMLTRCMSLQCDSEFQWQMHINLTSNLHADLDLHVKQEKDLEVRFGGMFSSRPINTGMVALRYNLFGRSSAHIDANSYFGKFYSAGQLRIVPWPLRLPMGLGRASTRRGI